MSVNQVNQTTGALSPIAGATYYSDTAVGSIIPFGGSVIPSSFLLCNGQSLLRADYPELFTVIGTNFGSVDSTHFNIPDLRDKFPEGASNTNTLGSAKSAGLPNITGNASIGYNDNSAIGVMTRNANGAFTTQTDGPTYWAGPAQNVGTTYGNSFHFDASRSNSIYGKSTTVQPPSVGVNFIIKATTIALPSDFEAAVDDKLDTKMDYHAYDSITLPSGCTRSYQQNRIKDLGDGMAIMTFSIMPINGEGYLPSGLTDLGTLPTKYTGILPASIYVPSSLGWTGCGNIYVSGGKILYLAGSSSGTVVTLNSIQRIAAGGVISY